MILGSNGNFGRFYSPSQAATAANITKDALCETASMPCHERRSCFDSESVCDADIADSPTRLFTPSSHSEFRFRSFVGQPPPSSFLVCLLPFCQSAEVHLAPVSSCGVSPFVPCPLFGRWAHDACTTLELEPNSQLDSINPMAVAVEERKGVGRITFLLATSHEETFCEIRGGERRL